MADLVDLVAPLAAYEAQGFEKQSDKIRTSRLENRKALMEIANEQARLGVQMSVEDMAKQAQSLLGPADWLYSMSPSQDVLAGMTASQNALANKSAEEQRRLQFATDVKETKDMRDFAAEAFAAGDDPATVTLKGQEMFGADRFNKVVPTLTRIQGESSFRGMSEGANLAKSMGFMADDAEEYISQNKSHLPQATQDGIRKTALANQSQAERDVISAASVMGGQGGYADNAVDAENMRNLIKTRFPTMSQDTLESVHKKAMDAARTAAQARIQADDNTAKNDARKIATQQDANMFMAAQQAEQQDLAQRDQRSKDFASRGQAVIANQEKIRQDVIGNKKTGEKPMFKDDADRTTALAALDQYKVDDFAALKEAIESHDPKKLKQVLSGLETLASYQERTQTAARLTTARIATPQEFYTIGAGLGASGAAVEDLGRKYKADLDAARKALTTGPAPSKDRGWGIEAAILGAPSAKGVDNEMAMASKNAAETRVNGLVATTVAHLKALREAAAINQSVAMTPEQITEQERRLAYGVARRFLTGAGENPSSVEFELHVENMSDDILKAAGKPMEVRRRNTAQDNIQAYRNSVAGGQGVQPNSMVPPGALQPNARSGYANGTAPAPF